MPKPPPSTPRPSATILLLRPGDPAMEVFMVERHHQIDFATGALVFPGGKTDAADGDGGLREHCDGAAEIDNAGLELRVCAIRETFEEAGVLLARPKDTPELVGGDRLRDLDQRWRDDLHGGKRNMLDMVREEGLRLACDRLTHYAHWITPAFMPKRFDTHFFLAEAPADQLAVHDGTESVDSVWTTVDDAVAAESSGERTIVFPTLLNLRKLGRSRTPAEAIEAALSKPVVTVLPEIRKDAAGAAMLTLPEEADYDVVQAPMDVAR